MQNFKKVTNKTEMRVENIKKPPKTAAEMVNCYGTYEVQSTCEGDNMYPAIAQGFNKKIIKNDLENEERQDNARKSCKKFD